MDLRVAKILVAAGQPVEIPASDDAGMDFIAKRALAKKPQLRSEISRICNLPITQPLDDEEFEAANLLHVKPEALRDGFLLERSQAEAIMTFQEHGGLFAPLPVGSGKTLISLRCVGIATEQGIDRSVLFVPPQVYSQLVNHDIAWVRRRLPLGCTFYQMGGLSPQRRKAIAGGRRGCWIFPYSLLSRPDSYDLLVSIAPQLMIFDEAHALKYRSSARTKRILTYYKKYRPKVVCLSGTMTSKSLNDYAHLISMCLKAGAPVPLDANVIQEWAAVLDSGRVGTQDYHEKTTGPGPLRPLIAWSNYHFPKTQLEFTPSGFRRAFLNRLSTTPGVVNKSEDTLGASLIVENLKADKLKSSGGAKLIEITDKLNNEWISPSGDELEHAMLVWKWNYELTAGIYNSLVWPTVGELVTKKNMQEHEAEQILEASKDYHESLQAYHKELRTWFRNHHHRPGIDTPMTVANEMARNGATNVGEALYSAWQDKNSLNFAQRIERDSIPVRVCDYKIRKALEWAKKEKSGGIIWYYHQEVGQWIFEMMYEAGFPVIHCHAGKKINDFLTSPDVAEKCLGKFLVCSIASHKEGKNLQFMQNQLFVQLPPTEQMTEQAIGRTHRKGQSADEVTVTTLISSEFDEMTLAALLNDAMYVRETMDDPRKLLISSWNPMPIVYGSLLLIRAGAQAKLLNARQQQALQERFNKTLDP